MKMMTLITLLTILISFETLANLVSSVPSTLPNIDLPNSHLVGRSGRVFRSMQPMDYLDEVTALGIDEVLIFKNQTSNEVEVEIELLQEMGIVDIHHIAFQWKNYESLESACGQLIEGLRLISHSIKNKRNLLIHCTVGEDRTGALAGLWRMLEEGRSAVSVFRSEMCARGYANGNPNKPSKVTRALEQELTPLFFAMAKKIESGVLTRKNLDESVCYDLEIESRIRRCR
jgi:protein tyrosine/serine phosphatase